VQLDLHFYGIYALARASGYPAGKAHILAYSSQYVDDATATDYPGLLWKPARTAHLGLETFSVNVQSEVYLPFHFTPGGEGAEPQALITKANSRRAEGLLQAAFATGGECHGLYRVGIALHAYADTWSHQGFGGMKSDLNAVDHLHADTESRYWTMAQIRWIRENYPLYKAAPRIGHAEALSYPDIPYLRWSYSDASGTTRTIDNPERYIEALEAIYAHLCRHGEERSARPWKTLRPPLLRLLKTRGSKEERERAWKRTIRNGDLFDFSTRERSRALYHKDRWRRDAVQPVFNRRNRRTFKQRPGFSTSHWARWHHAAEDHRKAFHAITP